MKIIPIYRYERAEGKITVSPDKPNVEYTEKCRIVADKGKLLTKDGVDFYQAIDTDTADGWYEVDNPNEEEW